MADQVLIVDDEPNIMLSLEFLMTQAGFSVRTASDGRQALQAVEDDCPDLILLDVMVPHVSGFEVCQTIRANPDWRHVKIILLTAKGRVVDQQKGLAMGADDYITKPFATQDVVEKAKALLAER